MQIVSIVAPIVAYLIDLLFVKKEVLIDGVTVVGNPMGVWIIVIAVICIISSIVSLIQKKNITLAVIAIILNLLLVVVSVF